MTIPLQSRRLTLASVSTLSALMCAALLNACGDDDTDDDTNRGGRGGRGGAAIGGTQNVGGGVVAGSGGRLAGGSGGDGGNDSPDAAGAGGAAAGAGGAAAGAGGAAAGAGGAAAGAGGDIGAGGNTDREVFRPEDRPFSDELVDGLDVAGGFELNVFATDLNHARMLATHGDHVYLTRPMQGDVLQLTDTDEDGVADETGPAVDGLPGVHGIAFDGNTVYLATPKEVHRGTVAASGAFTGVTRIIADLPDGGQHPNRTLGIGPDSALYISIGSSCDACAESNVEHATLLRSTLDGDMREIFASGLRNTIGFGWHPETEELWGFDHGSDWRGNDLPPEELNRLEAGNKYGWPYCFGEREVDPIIQDPPGGVSKEDVCEDTEAPVLSYQAHSAPIGMAFYTGTQFPEEYRDDAFVAMRGSWNRFPPTGYKIARLRFESGQPVELEDFVTGFLIEDGAANFARLAGVTVAPDGALLFSDDTNGVIYRVRYAE